MQLIIALKLGVEHRWEINWKIIQTLLKSIDDLLFGILMLHSMQSATINGRRLLSISTYAYTYIVYVHALG